MKIIWFFLASCIFLSSCAVPKNNIPNNYQLSDGAGVILLSLTASGECGFAYFTEIRAIHDQTNYSIGMQDFGHERDWKKKNDECPSKSDNFFGKLVAVEMPAGEYEIYQLEGMGKYRKVYAKKDFSVKFKVKANKVNYLGNVHLHATKKLLFYGAQDLRKRDIALFQEKYKQFNSKDIIMNLLHIKNIRTISA